MKTLIWLLKELNLYRIIVYFLIIIFFSSCNSNENTITLDDWVFEHEDIWRKAKVPGNNFSDLLSYNLIPEPFYGTNEDSIQWVSKKDWIYKSNFSLNTNFLDANKHSIIFNGLDTYAKVILNDSIILRADNMFRRWVIPLKGILKERNNIEIHFQKTSEQEIIKENQLGYKLPGGGKVHTRKAGFHYGWDWGPKIKVSGIWRPIEIKAHKISEIKDLYIEQKNISDSIADLKLHFELDVLENSLFQISINELTYDIQLNKGLQNIALDYTILKPELWWPHGYGKQKLYDIQASLKKNNVTLESINKKVGLRTIQLNTSKDSIGKNFFFEINGEPIFMKGANYIPQDNFQNNVSEDKYRKILQQVVAANMNMIRVWGGGIYEEDILYNLCDSLGILVWQDFMFACAMYPDNNEFLENVRLEAIDNIKRLRNYSSIILWCGNNEIAEAWQNWGWQNYRSKDEIQKISLGYKKLFGQILPFEVKRLTNLPYWESSPQLGRGDENHHLEGDVHYWGVWHDAQPFSTFEKKVPRFMSEFGFQSFPELSTIKKFSKEEDWFLDSKVMLSHQKHPRGNSLIQEYMKREYNQPKDFHKFIYASQVLQAEGMRIGLEAHRRSQPYCMGTLYWQLNDCWPVASWSSIDYYGNWKALHYVAKDVFSPLALSISNNKTKYSVWVMSDKRQNITDTLFINSYDLDGIKTQKTRKINIDLTKFGSHKIIDDYQNISSDEFIIANFKNQDISSKTIFTSKIKDLQFVKPTYKVGWSKNQLKIQVDKPAFQVYFELAGIKFESNYLTLLPNVEYTINYSGILINKENLLIWSLYDLNK